MGRGSSSSLPWAAAIITTRHIFPAVPACGLSCRRRAGALALGGVKCEPGDQLVGNLLHGSRPDFETAAAATCRAARTRIEAENKF